MTFEILFEEKAHIEYESSLRWYLLQSKPAGIKFVRTIENALITISKNPTIWPKIYKDHREFKLKKYPFSILFFVNEAKQQIYITSVFHFKRNPISKF